MTKVHLIKLHTGWAVSGERMRRSFIGTFLFVEEIRFLEDSVGRLENV
jgi:hypothetical protein